MEQIINQEQLSSSPQQITQLSIMSLFFIDDKKRLKYSIVPFSSAVSL